MIHIYVINKKNYCVLLYTKFSSTPLLIPLDPKITKDLYLKMLEIRYFEQQIEKGFARDQINGTTHVCSGQEAVCAGISAHLKLDDYVTSTHRGHGHALGKGLSPERIFGEVMGREIGLCKGKGGTQHVADVTKGFLGTNGITGGGMPLATGAALAIKYQNRNSIAVSFFGDGASNQGTFHESINMAAIWKLPVLFVCENNLYAMFTHISKTIPTETIAQRGEAYGIKSLTIDGMNAVDVYTKVGKIVEGMRGGSGPVLLECLTYRYGGHSKSDPRVYRTKEEEKSWKERDPIKQMKKYLIENNIYSADEIKSIDNKKKSEISSIYEKVLNSPYPDLESAEEDVYV